MMKSAPVVIIVSLFLQLAGGKDLYWQPNSNWGTPSNWALGRVPDCRDAASLASVPSNSVVYLGVDTTVRSISLPANGKLVLAPTVTIQLTTDNECTVPGDTQPMAAAVENDFIGATTHYWECATNWLTEDGLPVEHPPCGADRAIFEQGAFFNVKANDSIIVRSLSVRGMDIQSQTELSTEEFDLRIEINSDCGENPSFCPCPNDDMCLKPTSGIPSFTEAPSIVVGEAKGSNIGGGVIGGVVFGVVVILAVVTVVIIVVLLCVRKRSSVGYVKDDLLEAPVPASSNQAPYDNPLFDDDPVKVDLSLEKVGDVPKGTTTVPGITTYEANPPLYGDTAPEDDEKHVPKLNKYEHF